MKYAVEQARVSPADRRIVVAYSPDGRHLAAVEGNDDALVILALDDPPRELLHHPLDGLTVTGVAFAGPNHLAVLARPDPPGSAALLWAHEAPHWEAGPALALRRMHPEVLVGHPRAAEVLVAPRPGGEWDASGTASRHAMGVVAYRLADGAAPKRLGGAGPYGDPKDAWSLAWQDDAMIWVSRGSLRRARPGGPVTAEPVVDSRPVAQLVVTPSGLRLAQASPPRIGPPGGPLEELDQPPGTVLLQFLANPVGDQVAVVVQPRGGGSFAALAVGVQGVAAGSSLSLPWPLDAVALHPSRPQLAWVAEGRLEQALLGGD